MSALGKFALGLMGQLRPRPAIGSAPPVVALPEPQRHGGIPLMEALAKRQSMREFAPAELPQQLLSNLLWSAFGVNRSETMGRTAPSAINAQEIDLYVALPSGAYLFDAAGNRLQLVASSDLRRVTGYQDFVDDAALDLVYVADYSRMKLVPASQRESYASVPPAPLRRMSTCSPPATAWPPCCGPGSIETPSPARWA